MELRELQPDDEGAFLELARTVAHEGDTYVFDESTGDEELERYWLDPAGIRIVAAERGAVSGGYLLKPNQHGRGAHIATAAFIVAPAARGLGVGRALGEDALVRATRLGYRGMQFNLVVATNTWALSLWRSLGFEIVGSIPGAFRHEERGFVDAHVMYKSLEGAGR